MKPLIPQRPRKTALQKQTPFDLWMSDFFNGLADPDNRFEMRYLPAANLAETETDWIVSMELPGMSEKDVEVRVMGSQLVVSGERKQETESKDRQFHRIESSYGMFERRFELPNDVRIDVDSVDAKFRKGMLEIRVAKLEPKPVAKIPVRSD